MPVEPIIPMLRAERPGQSCGIPEITSSLSLFAMRRHPTLGVHGAAEQPALPSGVIYTDARDDAEAERDTTLRRDPINTPWLTVRCADGPLLPVFSSFVAVWGCRS